MLRQCVRPEESVLMCHFRYRYIVVCTRLWIIGNIYVSFPRRQLPSQQLILVRLQNVEGRLSWLQWCETTAMVVVWMRGGRKYWLEDSGHGEMKQWTSRENETVNEQRKRKICCIFGNNCSCPFVLPARLQALKISRHGFTWLFFQRWKLILKLWSDLSDDHRVPRIMKLHNLRWLLDRCKSQCCAAY